MTHITYTQATRLKALGFDKPTRDYIYTGDTANNTDKPCMTTKAFNHNAESLCVSLPTPYEVLDWFREEKKLFGVVLPIDDWNSWGFNILAQDVMSPFFDMYNTAIEGIEYPTHPEAISALVDKLIEILEEQKPRRSDAKDYDNSRTKKNSI